MPLLPVFRLAAPSLMQWSRLGTQVAKQTKPALAKAMNAFGRQVVDNAVTKLAERTGLSEEEVREQITVTEAKPGSLKWSMDASGIEATASDGFNGRPWDTPERGDEFDGDRLLNIVGAEDCCELCEEIRDNNPYTAEEISNFAAKWAHYEPDTGLGERTNLLHPNCRCATQPWKGYRRVQVSQKGGKGTADRTSMVTPAQLGKHIGHAFKGELRLVMSALKER